MAAPNVARIPRPGRNGPKLSAWETAAYARDLLKSLKMVALTQQQSRLAELLDAAATEAERLAETSRPTLRK
jgi:hypothetical protein